MCDSLLRGIALALLLVGLPAGLGLALALGEARTALVVGNAGYRDSPLSNPVNDAHNIAEALRAVGLDVTQKENLDKRGFDAAVSDFARQL